MTIMTCFGDSITDCGHCFSPDFLGDGYVKMLAGRFHREGYEIQMRNCGTDGFTVQRLLQRVKTDSTIIGNLAAVLIGINDIGMMMNTDRTPAQQEEMMGSFQEHYLELLTILTKSSCSVILMEPFVFSCPNAFHTVPPSVSFSAKGAGRRSAQIWIFRHHHRRSSSYPPGPAVPC